MGEFTKSLIFGTVNVDFKNINKWWTNKINIIDNNDIFIIDEDEDYCEIMCQKFGILIISEKSLKNLDLIFDYDPKIPEILLGDPIRLHQIILNLVSNAIKFTNHVKITVKVHIIEVINDNPHIEFAINDTGIGIEENKIESIFEQPTQFPTLSFCLSL